MTTHALPKSGQCPGRSAAPRCIQQTEAARCPVLAQCHASRKPSAQYSPDERYLLGSVSHTGAVLLGTLDGSRNELHTQYVAVLSETDSIYDGLQ